MTNLSIASCKQVTTAGVGVRVEGGAEENRRKSLSSFFHVVYDDDMKAD